MNEITRNLHDFCSVFAVQDKDSSRNSHVSAENVSSHLWKARTPPARIPRTKKQNPRFHELLSIGIIAKTLETLQKKQFNASLQMNEIMNEITRNFHDFCSVFAVQDKDSSRNSHVSAENVSSHL
ncbi:hypothetical protein QE152_g13558 [Popillia japonica]|uniref:Uncharacterized protein n=1 Tax=Popillia japonica TaxID=7064 RepID=A0AAW1LCK4_POPJA